MKVLLIQNARMEGPGLLGELMKERGWQIATYVMDQNGGNLPPTLAGCDAFIVLGGSMGAYEEQRYPHLKRIQELILESLRQQVPGLGICLGAQLMARALGAHVGPNPVKEIGWYQLQLTETGTRSPLFHGIPSEFSMFQWHGDTFALPQGALLLAQGKTCINQAFEYNRHLWAVQFHPEVTPKMVAEWTGCMSEQLIEFRGQTGIRVLKEKTAQLWESCKDTNYRLLDNIEGLLSRRLVAV